VAIPHLHLSPEGIGRAIRKVRFDLFKDRQGFRIVPLIETFQSLTVKDSRISLDRLDILSLAGATAQEGEEDEKEKNYIKNRLLFHRTFFFEMPTIMIGRGVDVNI
jgi:hypothetical protein